MTNIIRIELNRLTDIVNTVSNLVSNKKFGNTEKQTLFLTYYDMNEEHLKAIHLLLSNDCEGSAYSLIRTYYETFFRALWVNAYATSEVMEKIRDDNFNFTKDDGNMGSKINKLDEYYTGTSFFKDLKKATWGNMSDFTHSGSKQLSRRWKDDKLESNYIDNEILEIIIEITKTYLWFSYMLLKIHDYKIDNNKIFDLYIQYKEKTDLHLEKIYNNENKK